MSNNKSDSKRAIASIQIGLLSAECKKTYLENALFAAVHFLIDLGEHESAINAAELSIEIIEGAKEKTDKEPKH